MKDAIEPASSEPGFYSLLFVTLKVTGNWRPVIDLSRLNSFVHLSHFCMETSLSVFHSLHPGDWMISIDLQDAYLQVSVHPESRRYLRFCLGHQTFQFRALCFGLSSAPQVFTHVMAPDLLHYASFWLSDPVLSRRLAHPRILASGDCAGERLFVMALWGTMGSGEPFQEFSHTDSDLRLSRHDSSVDTFEGFPDPGLDALSRRRVLLEQPLSLWRSFLGVMSSMSTLIPGSRLRMRSLQLRFNVAGPEASEDALISWDDSCHLDLQWWSVTSHLDGGVSLDLPQPHRFVFTDALDSGWGASLGEDRLSGLWSRYVST